MPGDYRITKQGDGAITIHLSDHRDADVARRIIDLLRRLDEAGIDRIADIVPALTSVTCVLRDDADPDDILPQVTRIAGGPARFLKDLDERRVEIPICFEPEFQTDLELIAREVGLSVEDVIALQLSADYRVAMIGFLPGFPYLEGLPEQLSRPRRPTPRDRVPSGSVAIAGEYCGIYPVESPGGWWIIGATPLVLFDPFSTSPAFLSIGDRCRFRRIRN